MAWLHQGDIASKCLTRHCLELGSNANHALAACIRMCLITTQAAASGHAAALQHLHHGRGCMQRRRMPGASQPPAETFVAAHSADASSPSCQSGIVKQPGIRAAPVDMLISQAHLLTPSSSSTSMRAGPANVSTSAAQLPLLVGVMPLELVSVPASFFLGQCSTSASSTECGCLSQLMRLKASGGRAAPLHAQQADICKTGHCKLAQPCFLATRAHAVCLWQHRSRLSEPENGSLKGTPLMWCTILSSTLWVSATPQRQPPSHSFLRMWSTPLAAQSSKLPGPVQQLCRQQPAA